MKLFRGFDGLSFIGIAFVALISLPFLGIGLFEAYRTQKKINAFIHVDGTVIDNSYATTNHDGTLSGAYYPVIEFTPQTGTPVRFNDGVGSLPPDYAAGDKVAVIYNPLNPKDARIYSWKRLWFAPALFIAIGSLPIIIAIFIMRALRRSLK